MNFRSLRTQQKTLLVIVSVFFILAILGYFIWHSLSLSKSLSASKGQTETQAREFASTTDSLKRKIALLEDHLTATEKMNDELREKYEKKKKLTDELQETVKDISNTVGYIKDYALTDPELLKKYSSVYFLNENYAPPKLTEIPEEYHQNKDEKLEVRSEVYPYLEDLFKAAEEDGISLKVISAYRSFGQQATLKGHYAVIYGRDTANTFSADQGYSEHQMGTTVDLTTDALGENFSAFDTTTGYQWMTNNAYKHGFILSYPKGNPYYEYEPWHWRFVGVKLATDLHEAGDYFYDWGQRELDSYRGDIFN